MNLLILLLALGLSLPFVTDRAYGKTGPEVSAPLFIDDEDQLKSLENSGLALNAILESDCGVDRSTDCLFRVAAYRKMVAAMAQDILVQRIELKKDVSEKNWKSLDSFRINWLTSRESFFDLVGVILRPDRSLQAPDTCGEFRLIYRLGFVSGERSSRLPMTLMVEYDLPRDPKAACLGLWQEWARYLAKAKSGKTAERPTLALANFQRIKLNTHVNHLPTFKKSKSLEQGYYLLRSFKRLPDGSFEVEALENTLDLNAMAKPGMKAAFLDWLLKPETLQSVDKGDYLIPKDFLAHKSFSILPFGMSRVFNQTVSRVVTESDLSGADLSAFTHIKTPAALLRRLDSFSCQGCHVSRSVAGFHFMGGSKIAAFNTLVVPYSNHFSEVQAFRESFLDKKIKDPLLIPPPEHSNPKMNGLGQHCGLPGDEGFAAWTCGETFSCNGGFPGIPSQKVGRCLPVVLDGSPGQSCEKSTMNSDPNPFKDHLTDLTYLECKGNGISKGNCGKAFYGFPAGRCFQRCEPGFVEDAQSVCGASPKQKEFAPCLATGESFESCVINHSFQSKHMACSKQSQCNDDYVCSGLAGKTRGACMPSYTLPQLLIRGHPTL